MYKVPPQPNLLPRDHHSTSTTSEVPYTGYVAMYRYIAADEIHSIDPSDLPAAQYYCESAKTTVDSPQQDVALDFTPRYRTACEHLQDFGRIDGAVVVVGNVFDVSQHGEAVLDLSTHGVSLSSTQVKEKKRETVVFNIIIAQTLASRRPRSKHNGRTKHFPPDNERSTP